MDATKRRTSWKYFRNALRTNHYPLGDAYQDEKRERVLDSLKAKNESWQLEESNRDSYPYLEYVKKLVKGWPQLQLLVDFMEVGTVPMRWGLFPGETTGGGRYTYDPQQRYIQRNLRAKRTNVALLEYSDDNTVKLERYKEPYDGNCHSAAELKERLQQLGEEPGNGKKARFRLFVVEDLSRDVIETLGYHLKIDPRFFRSHLVDYAWNNIRDPWREPRTSQVNAQQQDWFQIRFIRSRYFTDKDSLEASYHESNEFNVQRRVDPDENESFWDSDENYARERSRAEKKGAEATAAAEKAVEAKVGLIRSRATIWMRHETDGATIGVLLLDPTIEHGYPLWRGYDNWEPPPLPGSVVGEQLGPPSMRRDNNTTTKKSWFEDFLYWAQKPTAFETTTTNQDPKDPSLIPAHVLLHLISAEWGTMADYINTRLNQIRWEIEHPAHFWTGDRQHALGKLHIWRRWVPICREMLSETLQQVPRFQWRKPLPETEPEPEPSNIMHHYATDFQHSLSSMQEYQNTIDRLTSVVTAIINIEDIKRNMKDSQNVGNITILATIFIPPTFFATFFSMTEGPVSELGDAYKWWAIASFPSIILLFSTFWLLQQQGPILGGVREVFSRGVIGRWSLNRGGTRPENVGGSSSPRSALLSDQDASKKV